MCKFKTTLLAIGACSVMALGAINAHANSDADICNAITAEVQISGGNVCVAIHDGVATLSGYVENEVDKNAAQQAAESAAGVTEVINLITVSR